VLTGRRHFPKGPFHLGKWGLPVYISATLFIVLFNTFYCFRRCSPPFLLPGYATSWNKGDADSGPLPAYVVPTTAEIMNYNSVILVGIVALTGVWWLIHAREHYPGPKVMTMYIHDDHHHTVTEAVPVASKGEKES